MALLPPKNRLWWNEPLHRMETIWITIAFLWGLLMFFVMIWWHVTGDQNLSNESYRIQPDVYAERTEAFIEAHQVGEDDFGTPIVRPPVGSDVYLAARLWDWYPILELVEGETYRLHISSLDWQHGFSLQPTNINLQVHPGIELVVTLTPNENYWGTQPTIPQVVIQFIEDTSAQIQALKAKEVSAANPQPQLELGAQLGDDPDLQVDVNVKTTFLEALWINMAEAPWDDKVVRQALAYAIDRDAVVGALFGDFGVDVASQSLIQPAAELYVTDAFASYTRDLEKVDELMTGAGWEKNSDGFWEKSA